ncbi:MAG: TIGR02147 family protein [Bacteriovoracaceae bacterium]|jgi:uncharacterized protein (TIGR02147 family)|nr:TIGR02147 family protein [Bacteriovoracaceae bacterium]
MYDSKAISFLKEKFEQRKSAEKNYGLREMAREVNVSPALLSLIFSGKKPLSLKSVIKISQTFFKDKIESELFKLYFQLKDQNNPEIDDIRARAKSCELLLNKRSWHMEEGQNLVWKDLALLELINIKNPQNSEEELKKLGQFIDLCRAELQESLRRLIKADLIFIDRNIFYKKTSLSLKGQSFSSDRTKEIHQGFINEALKSFNTQAIENNYINTQTLSVTKEDLKTYIDLIKDFYSKAIALGLREENNKADGLYTLNIQFFDITQGKL